MELRRGKRSTLLLLPLQQILSLLDHNPTVGS